MSEEPRWMGGPRSGLNPFEAENRRLREERDRYVAQANDAALAAAKQQGHAERLREALERIALYPCEEVRGGEPHTEPCPGCQARAALDREGEE
jgi:rubrerythrin